MAKPQIRIGCSGWHYDHWTGPFYPEGTKPEDMLAVYAERFDAVEVNNTFYSLPDKATLDDWTGTVPADFRFAVKGSRYLTHMKKLKDPQEPIDRLFTAIDPLGDRLGPVLFQLPGGWNANPERLDAFLGQLPKGHCYAVECRDESWHDVPVYEVLSRHDAAFVIYEYAGTITPLQATSATLVYIRLHGPGEAYQGSYDDETLDTWAERIAAWRDGGRSVWCFFDNDQNGYAPINALALKQRLGT
jgi:uncharacterized protein YecE (DUF72 family)